jgi:hypothetical protein
MAYSKEDIERIFKDIILDIESGMSLRASLLKEDRPESHTFYKWIEADEEKILQYARGTEKRADVIFEDILSIADDASGDKKFTENGEVIDSEFVARSRIRIDARKWMLGKMQPKKYGDKIQQEHSGEVTTNIISLGAGTKPNEANR